MSNSFPVVNNLFSTVFSKSLLFKLLFFFFQGSQSEKRSKKMWIYLSADPKGDRSTGVYHTRFSSRDFHCIVRLTQKLNQSFLRLSDCNLVNQVTVKMVSAPKVNECLRSIFFFCFSSFFPQAFLSLKEISWLYSKIIEGDSQAKLHNSNNHSLSAQSSFNKSSRFCTSKKPASVLEQCGNNNTSSHLPPYISYLPVCLLCIFDKRSYI